MWKAGGKLIFSAFDRNQRGPQPIAGFHTNFSGKAAPYILSPNISLAKNGGGGRGGGCVLLIPDALHA